MGKAGIVFTGIILGLVVVAFFAFFSAFLVQWAWNGAAVAVFGAKAITWLQAFQLSLLASSLLKSTQTNNKG